MDIFDIMEKRDDDYHTIGLIDTDEDFPNWVIIYPGYAKNRDPQKITYKTTLELRQYLYKDLKGDTNDLTAKVSLMIDACYNYGGINVNLESGNWKAL